MTEFRVVRGNDFRKKFTLGNDIVKSVITEVWFTIRTAIPDSGITDDSDLADLDNGVDGVAVQVAMTTPTSDGSISFPSEDSAEGTVFISRDVLNTFRIREPYFWDIQFLTNSGVSETPDKGLFIMEYDITRTLP